MKTKHTKEKWLIDTTNKAIEKYSGYYVINTYEGKLIALCAQPKDDYSDLKEREANLELIAKAPETLKQRDKLLTACEAMVKNIDKWIESGKPATEKRSEELYIQMKAAINNCE